MSQPQDCATPGLYVTCQACYKPNYPDLAGLSRFDPIHDSGRQGWYITCGSCGARVPISDTAVQAAGPKRTK